MKNLWLVIEESHQWLGLAFWPPKVTDFGVKDKLIALHRKYDQDVLVHADRLAAQFDPRPGGDKSDAQGDEL
jgi:hypothetical protein